MKKGQMIISENRRLNFAQERGAAGRGRGDLSNIPDAVIIEQGQQRNVFKPNSGMAHLLGDYNDDGQDISYNITRESNNILLSIPFCLFAPVMRGDSYLEIFQQCKVMPPGAATVTFTIDNATGDGLFTWTIGGNTDVIRIHATGLVTYSTQLNMVDSGGNFLSSGFRYGADAVNFTRQYAAYNLFIGGADFDGVTIAKSRRIKAMKGPDQFQNAIVDVAYNLAVDNTKFLVSGFPSDVVTTPNEITWDFFEVDYQSHAIF